MEENNLRSNRGRNQRAGESDFDEIDSADQDAPMTERNYLSARGDNNKNKYLQRGGDQNTANARSRSKPPGSSNRGGDPWSEDLSQRSKSANPKS